LIADTVTAVAWHVNKASYANLPVSPFVDDLDFTHQMSVCFRSCVDGAMARTFWRYCSIGRVRSRVRPVCAAGYGRWP